VKIEFKTGSVTTRRRRRGWQWGLRVSEAKERRERDCGFLGRPMLPRGRAEENGCSARLGGPSGKGEGNEQAGSVWLGPPGHRATGKVFFSFLFSFKFVSKAI
jgi:hypothetical protein